MKNLMKRFWKEEDGMGTIEIVVIIAVLLAVALLFRDGIIGFTKNMMNKFFDPSDYDVEQESGYNPPGTPGTEGNGEGG